MKKLWLLVLFVHLVMVTLSCGGTSQPVSTAVGKQVYDANCSSCHGTNGAGGIKIGAVTTPDIRAKVMSDVFKNDSELIKAAILNGKDEESHDLNAAMPRFQGKLSDADVTAVIAYLKTLK